MSEEEKKAMNENEIKFRAYLLILNSEFPTHRKTEAMEELLKIYNNKQKEIERLNSIIKTDNIINKERAELIEQQQKEIEELKKVIKMVEIYKSYGIPEDAEMVIMRKDDFLRNTNNEFISKDKIRAKIKDLKENDNGDDYSVTNVIMILKGLLEE